MAGAPVEDGRGDDTCSLVIQAAAAAQDELVFDVVRSSNERYLADGAKATTTSANNTSAGQRSGWGAARTRRRHRPFDVPAAANALLLFRLLASRDAERRCKEDGSSVDDANPEASCVPWLVVSATVDALPEPVCGERSATSMNAARSVQRAAPSGDVPALTPKSHLALCVSPWHRFISCSTLPAGGSDGLRLLPSLPDDMPWLTGVVLAGVTFDVLQNVIRSAGLREVYITGPREAPQDAATTGGMAAPGVSTLVPRAGVRLLTVSSSSTQRIVELVKFTFDHHPTTLAALDISTENSSEAKEVFDVFADKTLESLTLAGRAMNGIATQMLQTIPEPPKVMKTLRQLSLTYQTQQLDRGCLRVLFGARELAPQLTALELTSCGITSDSMSLIAESLDEDERLMPSLTTLGLSINQIENAGVGHIIGCRRVWTALEKLDLRSNPITDIGTLQQLAAMFRQSSTLRCLQVHPAGGGHYLNVLGMENKRRCGAFVM